MTKKHAPNLIPWQRPRRAGSSCPCDLTGVCAVDHFLKTINGLFLPRVMFKVEIASLSRNEPVNLWFLQHRSMKYLNGKSFVKYLYTEAAGNFIGFLIGASATGLVSHFFETRSIRNLWGLTAKKTLVDKETFGYMEWGISILIGFIVFEIVTNILIEGLESRFPRMKQAFFRWMISNQWHVRFREYAAWFRGRRIVYVAAVHQGIRQALSRYSRRS